MSRAKIGVVIHTALRELLFTPEDCARLNALGEVAWTDSLEPVTVSQARKILHGCKVGVGSWGTPCPSPELLKGCSHLRLWEHVAGSVKHMFGPHLEGRDLIIASCKPAIAENVAEMTLGEIILGLRRVFENAVANHFGAAAKPAHLKLLSEATVGVIGASEVGRCVIRLLRPFGCRILLHDPHVSAEGAAEMGAALVAELLELCRESDVVTLHTPALPATRKLLGAQEFRAMRDDAVFINTARGECVDEEALLEALEAGQLFAFLDVTDPEPAAPDSPLRKLPNVVLTSHIAGPPRFNMGRQAVDDIESFLKGDLPLCVAREEDLDRIA